jgi:DNA/RNA-binding domain of Phe-tRNA-synthetase-like protein
MFPYFSIVLLPHHVNVLFPVYCQLAKERGPRSPPIYFSHFNGAGFMFTASPLWKTTYPQAAIGILALENISNPASHAELDHRKEALEATLREQFAAYSREELRALPSVEPYVAYYKRFKKTYHVLHQLESVAQKEKSIPRTAALVEAMFMAELKNQLLTAGHDFDALQMPVGVTVGQGGETYVGLGGRDLSAKAGDMMIQDAAGIISSIVFGPDERTRIAPGTRRVLFTVYAPAGIERRQISNHLEDLKEYTGVISPRARVIQEGIIGAG